MADRAVSDLIEAEQITSGDLFLLEQGGTAKKLTGQTLITFLTALADGHGGISEIKKLGSEGLVDTYEITLADGSNFDFAVTNGAKGDKGDNAYTWIKYASQEPSEDSGSIGDIPDAWMGIYAGPLAVAPADWHQYKWFNIKGAKGDKGDPAVVTGSSVGYQVGTSATEIPSGEWLAAIPETPQGAFLWSRTVHTFNTGEPVTVYAVSRMGIDGLGTLRTINGLSADANGNINLSAESIGALAKTGDAMEGMLNANGHRITGLPAPTAYSDAVPYSMILERQVKRWENSAPSSTFAGQNLQFNITSPYRYLEVYFYVSTQEEIKLSSGRLVIPDAGGTVKYRVMTPYSMTQSTTVMARRDFTLFVTDEYVAVQFDDAVYGAGATQNNMLIPCEIYMYKGDL